MIGFQSEREIESSKTLIRWIAIVLLALVGRSVFEPAAFDAFWAIVGGACAVNIFHTFYLARVDPIPPAYKYLSVAADLGFLSAAILVTGHSQSPFFFLYFVILISNCLRYGLLMSLYVAVVVNLLYVGILSVDPRVEPSVVGGEGLKILAFWSVALYGGVVSSRIQRQAHVLASYEDTIAELRAELKRLETEKESTDET